MPNDHSVKLAKMNETQIACITGATGQIGSYLCEILLQEGYVVRGLRHRSASPYPLYMDRLLKNHQLELILGDITDASFINDYVSRFRPNLFINCAAQSNVVSSFSTPEYTMRATGDSVINCLEAIRQYSPDTRFITLGSSLMFGDNPPPQNESTMMIAESPYAQAKIKGYNATINYRKEYNLFACNAICFNSESYRRSEDYVSRKITRTAARIKLGLQDKLILGNLQSLRDFSHAQDTANAIYQIITADEPDDFIIASGQSHSVQEFVELAFTTCRLNWQDYVITDPKFLRNKKESIHCGNASKIRAKLNWEPKYSFADLVREMVNYDLMMEYK